MHFAVFFIYIVLLFFFAGCEAIVFTTLAIFFFVILSPFFFRLRLIWTIKLRLRYKRGLFLPLKDAPECS